MSNNNDILNEVLNEFKSINGVEEVIILDDEMKKQLLLFEKERLKEIIPVLNKGLNDSFAEEHSILIIKTFNNETMEFPSLTLVSENGKIIGEEVYDEEELEEYKERDDVYFLSDNFVTFKNIFNESSKNQKFIISSIPFKEVQALEKLETIEKIVCATPSTTGDNYLRELYGYLDNEDIGALVVGFSLKS